MSSTRAIYPWTFALRAQVEWQCLRECLAFSLRHRRYFLISLVIYRYALTQPRRSRALRYGFCFLQHIDDVLDGDRRVSEEPLEYVARMHTTWQRRSWNRRPLDLLGRAFCEAAEAMAGQDDQPHQDTSKLIGVMMFDRRRVRDQLLLTESELRHQWRETFRLSVNLLMLAADTKLRARDAQSLLEAFGWVSAMRDLEEDLDKGLINIPVDVVALEPNVQRPDLSYQGLIGLASVRQWIAAELERGKLNLERATLELANAQDPKGVRVLRIFLRSMVAFGQRLPRRHPDWFPGPS